MSSVPILFHVGRVPIYSHGFFLLFGLLAGLGWVVIEARRRRWSKEEVIPITLAAFVGGMIGAKVSILFFNGFEYAPLVLKMYTMFNPRIGPGLIIGGYIASKAICRVPAKQSRVGVRTDGSTVRKCGVICSGGGVFCHGE